LRILIDTDVLLDLALGRDPHAADAARVIQLVQHGSVDAVVAWHTIANVYYMLSSARHRNQALEFIRDLAGIAAVAPVGSEALTVALSLRMTDFEDAMQVASALAAGAEVIVTRNTRDFRTSPVRAVAPRDYIGQHDRG
jgi:PIN domain.